MEEALPQQMRHLLVEGRVQGVGFRWFTRERARRRGLRGWVQNRPDGSVEVQVSGHAEVLAGFVAELSQGPNGAHVTAVRDLYEPGAVVDSSALPYPFHIQRQPLAT
ncbi:MAG: acylphosphatase [Gemmatimonadaceae bacterium]